MKKVLAILLAFALALSCFQTVLAAPASQPDSADITKSDAQSYPLKNGAQLYGFAYCCDSAMPEDTYGWVSMMSDDPEGCSYRTERYSYAFVAGDYVADTGLVYALKQVSPTENYFVSVNPETFEETLIADYGDMRFGDMTYDYSTETMYGVWQSDLYTVDLETGETILVGNTGTNVASIACTTEGDMYAITAAGNFCSVDKSIAALTTIGATGFSGIAIFGTCQSMTWDHVNGGLYWSRSGMMNGGLYSIDLTAGTATELGNIYGDNMGVTCLYTVKTSASVSVDGVTLNLDSAQLMVGRTLELIATVTPENATNKNITWVSSNVDVATVDENGVVTAHSAGSAIIRVTTEEGLFTDECEITVPDTTEADAAFDAAINAAGETRDFLNDEAYPWEIVEDGNRVYVKSTTQGIDNSVTTVSLNGSLHMYRTSTITFDWFVSSEGLYVDELSFLINGEVVARIGGEEMSDFETYTWTATAEGDYTFSWRYKKDFSDSSGDDMGCIDNVAIYLAIPAPVSGVELTPETADLFVGTDVQLAAEVLPSNAANLNVTFSSSNESIATVDEFGVVTAIGTGSPDVDEAEVIITVTTEEGHYTDTATITVKSLRMLDQMLSDALNVEGGTLSFVNDRVNIWDIDSTTYAPRTVAQSTTSNMNNTSTSVTLEAETDGEKIIIFDWMISSERNYDEGQFFIDGEKILEISGTTMSTFETVALFAGEAGTHTYTWTYTKDGSMYAGQDMMWLDNVEFTNPPSPESVEMISTLKLHVGMATTLTATVLPTYASDLTITFSSSDEDVVTVDANTGLVTAVSAGTASITASASNGVNAVCEITVSDTLPPVDGYYYGYCVNPGSFTAESGVGFTRIDPFNSTVENLMRLEGYGYVAAMEYYNGVIYGYIDEGQTKFFTMDPITFEIMTSVPVPTYAYDMTYDYTTNTMYALTFAAGNREISTVDLSTGEFTRVATITGSGDNIITLACDNNGDLYGVESFTSGGLIYRIDKNTAVATFVGSSDFGSPNNMQSMDYDYLNDRLVWASYATSPTSVGILYEVDRSTGAVTPIIQNANMGVFTGLLTFDNPSAVTDPVPVTGVSVNPTSIEIDWGGSGKLNAVFAPSNATDRRVTWISADETIVTVDNAGNVTAVNTGTTTVTVTTMDGGYSAAATVTVGASPYMPLPAGKAMIVLTAGDVYGDGSGYQMLLDSTATLFGTTIPTEAGELTPGGNVPAEIYELFDYKIPENADGALDTDNIVFENSIGILVDAGTFDYCITNPVPFDKMWIASSANGSVGRGDDIVFEEGYRYEFSLSMYMGVDFVTMTTMELGTIPEEEPVNMSINIDRHTAEEITFSIEVDSGSFTSGSFRFNINPAYVYPIAIDPGFEGRVTYTAFDEVICFDVADGEPITSGTLITVVLGIDPPGLAEFSLDCSAIEGASEVICTTLNIDLADLPQRPMGDVNGDNVLNTGDCAYLLRWAIGLETLSDEDMLYADINNDGAVNTGDAAIILEMCVN